MLRYRIRHFVSFGSVVTLGLLLVLGVRFGVTAAAIGTPDAARSSALPQGKVRIHLQGSVSGSQFAAFGRGRFTASGAISDQGRFVDEFHGIHPLREPHTRMLYGRRGMLLIDVDRDGRWRVARGTKAYAGLRGRGTLTGRYAFRGIDATMIGTVSR